MRGQLLDRFLSVPAFFPLDVDKGGLNAMEFYELTQILLTSS